MKIQEKKKFQEKIEKRYPNVKCEIMEKNEGYCFGNNLGIKLSKTRLVFILNPDVLLEKNTLEELFEASKKLKEFSILAPLEKNFINYGFFNKKK